MPFGVDEAGKGPVLGSMFAASVVGEPGAIPDGVADSKTLTPERRTELARELAREPAVSIGVGEVPVAEIDDPETDMNTLTVAAHARALRAVEIAGESGHVDAGDVNAERFGRRVADRLDVDVSITAEHGADERRPLVSAASVIAKVSRDAHVEAIGVEYGTDVGSGYPGDERTRDFLSGHLERTGELPACARHTWQTCRDLKNERGQTGLEEF
ncbi:MAG: ribonuclease HII [Halodesulfurarchaeum sp.]